MKFFLLERYLTLITPEQKEEYKDIVWDILERSYNHEAIGGFWTHKNADDLVRRSNLWKLCKKDGEIIAAAVYRDELGRKCIGLGSNGTLSGIEAVMRIMKEDQDPKLRRAWIEISKRLDILWHKIDGKQIPAKLATSILKRALTPLDDYHYERDVLGHKQEKSIWGYPKIPELSLESVKFKIIGFQPNPSYDWQKRKKPKPPKTEKSIPDSDLCAQKGKSYRQAQKAYIQYRYKGKPYGVTEPHT